MQTLTRKELLEVNGGAFTINGTYLNSIIRGINAILELGRSLGSAIRRASGHNICPIS